MTRKKAIATLKKIEGSLRTAQALIVGYADDLKAIREWLEGAGKKS